VSTECASPLKEPVDALHHVVMVDKFASVRLRDAFLNTGDETRLIFQHAGNRVFH